MAGKILTPRECLARIPQQEPFRFIDELSELDENGTVGHYRWRSDHEFYRGHFPDNPVTPGVLLIECMAQCSVVPLGLYLAYRDFEEADRMVTMFTDTTMEFLDSVGPDERVTVRSERVFYRMRKLRVRAEMRREDGTLVCNGELAGLGVVL